MGVHGAYRLGSLSPLRRPTARIMTVAKKKAAKVNATKSAPTRTGRPVRLDLTEADHERLEQCAKQIGLTKASYARMAVMERIKADESKGADKG